MGFPEDGIAGSTGQRGGQARLHVSQRIQVVSAGNTATIFILEGGFALITGDPGTGKSVVLRLLAALLSQQSDLSVAALNLAVSVSAGCRLPVPAPL